MDGMSSPGDLMLRYPGWEKTGELAGANAVWSIIQAEDGSLYAGTMENGDVFRSTDAGTTWVNTAELPGAWGALSVLETMDGTVYATALDGVSAKVYKTTDGGTTWLQTGDLPEVEGVYKLMQAEDGAIYASGTKHLNFPEWPGWVWKTTNGGTTWIMTSYMGDSITNVYTVFQAADRSIYAGGWGSSHAFRTTDGGARGAGPVRRVR